MAKFIGIKKGLDINLKGKASTNVFFNVGESESYAIIPDHYVGITPKVLVREGDNVKSGAPVMCDKNRPEIKFVSPVNGVVSGVNRGEKRKVLSITIKPDERVNSERIEMQDISSYDAGGLKALLLETGLWPYIKQRPYDRVANPSDTPRDIFVTAYNSAPLAPEVDFLVKSDEGYLQTGLGVLAKLTGGKVYFGVKQGSPLGSAVKDVEVVEVSGPHPAGNVGVLINNVKPVNKGEVVWTLNAADVFMMGRMLQEKQFDFSKVIALTGSEFKRCGYTKVISGCNIGSIVNGLVSEGNVRLISGNVLTGTKVGREDYLGAYDSQITAIPEGDDVDEFLGWATPGLNKFSASRTYFSWLNGGKSEYVLDARIRGGKRAMIMSNEYDKVFPMDILPEYLLKAIIAFDIDKMENLGIYEVAPEDFALCEFVDTSKIE
ncbi:MAG: Na(+)-translocating NADH-quinone reductase subunit A, partial [Tannerella sp.]|nr:Na(+)-translocating NADH-quinone reductase subunit A [Tannerella sp.]